MDIVFTSLMLLFAVALSGMLMGLLPFSPPKPLVQIGIGAALALPGFGLHVALQPELFFLLFIPPLLFADGWRMPRREFRRLGLPITTLALGLVLFTVLCIGYLVHWLIPAVPLAVAFALGAVLSPTDAVAVSSISGRARMPRRLMHILQGEALMNDASALVALRFAVAAALTGTFALGPASVSFALIAAGGLAVGVVLGWMFASVRQYLTRWRASDPTSHVALLLLIPYAAYLIGDVLNVSGILSVVAAGMTLNRLDTLKGDLSTRMQANDLWSMLEFVFNGMIFVLLGLQMPDIVRQAGVGMQAIGGGLWQLGWFVIAITCALLATRGLWIGLLLLGMRIHAGLRGGVVPRLSLPAIGIATLAGVRGAITLAAALSLPLTLIDGTPFPARGVLVFVAAGVILATLLIGSISLPLLVRALEHPDEDPIEREERDARAIAAQAAVRAIEAHRQTRAPDDNGDAGLYADASARVLSVYQPRLDPDNRNADSARVRRAFETEKQLRLAALRAEREEIYRLRNVFRINDETLRRILADIDRLEAALLGPDGRR